MTLKRWIQPVSVLHGRENLKKNFLIDAAFKMRQSGEGEGVATYLALASRVQLLRMKMKSEAM